MQKMNEVDWLAFIFIVIGGLNWGLIALFNFDLVTFLFGAMTPAARLIYGIVGLAAVYLVASAVAKAGYFGTNFRKRWNIRM